MNIKQLIDALSKCNPNDQAFMWIDGERYPVGMIDEMGGYVDLNAQLEPTKPTKTFHIYKQVSYEYFVEAEDFDSAIRRIIDENPAPESEDLIEWVLADEHAGKDWTNETTGVEA